MISTSQRDLLRVDSPMRRSDRMSYSGQRLNSFDQTATLRTGDESVRDPESPKSKGFFLTSNAMHPRSYKTVQELHNKLQKEINKMDTKIGNAINRHDRNFTKSYRESMEKTQLELFDLKRKFESEELKYHHQQNILDLQTKSEELKEEIQKLTNEVAQERKENEALRAHISMLTNKNDFLNNYISCNSERTLQIRQEVGRILSDYKPKVHPRSFPVFELSLNQSLLRGRNSTHQKDASQPESKLEPTVRPKLENNESSPMKKFRNLMREIKQIDNIQSIIEKVEKTGQAIIQEYEKKLNDITQMFQRETKAKSKDSRSIASDYRPAELEQFFIECVDQVRKEIFKRKLLAQKEFNGLKNSESQSNEIAATIQGIHIRNVPLDKFLTSDRIKLLDLFINDERVLQYLYHGIFSGFRSKKAQPAPLQSNLMSRKIKISEGDNDEPTPLNTSNFLKFVEEQISSREPEKAEFGSESCDAKLLKELPSIKPRSKSTMKQVFRPADVALTSFSRNRRLEPLERAQFNKKLTQLKRFSSLHDIMS